MGYSNSIYASSIAVFWDNVYPDEYMDEILKIKNMYKIIIKKTKLKTIYKKIFYDIIQ